MKTLKDFVKENYFENKSYFAPTIHIGSCSCLLQFIRLLFRSFVCVCACANTESCCRGIVAVVVVSHFSWLKICFECEVFILWIKEKSEIDLKRHGSGH